MNGLDLWKKITTETADDSGASFMVGNVLLVAPDEDDVVVVMV